MSSGSTKAVYVALGANSLVMVAKFFGFFISGSSAMLAEGIHSAADVGNQALLALGIARSKRPADDTHPEGYGREAFVWSLISAVGIFFLGCGFTVMHGISSLTSAEHGEQNQLDWAVGILLFSLVIESGSLMVAVMAMKREATARGLSFKENIKTTPDPFGLAILLEDSAAVLGVLVALITLGLAIYTHQGFYDAIGSILIGLLLGFVALFLISKNSGLLIGRRVNNLERDKLIDILESDPLVEEVSNDRLIITGAETVRVSAEIDIDGRYISTQVLSDVNIVELHASLNSPDKLEDYLGEFGESIANRMGQEIDRLEMKIKEALPGTDAVDLEPD